ncbi:MAG: DNA translocase FtsK, partial [Anaerolineaceae bacterium]
PPAADDGSPSASGLPVGAPLKQVPLWDDMIDMEPEKAGDPLYEDAVDLVRREGRASISMLQRRMRIGYTRAARLVDTMEEKGIIGEAQSHTQVREVLDYGPAAPPKEE